MPTLGVLQARLQELRELGVRGAAFRSWWEFKTRSGLGAYLELPVEKLAFELAPAVRLDPRTIGFASPESVMRIVEGRIGQEAQRALLTHANDAACGRILCFGRWHASYGDPIDWHLNPISRYRWAGECHWSSALKHTSEIGDVKFTWEVGRFPHGYWMGRAGAFFPDYRQRFCKSLLQHIEAFESSNPFGRGVHWYSGQEVAIRTLSFLFAYHAFGYQRPFGEYVARALYRAGLYLQSHIDYSREAVYNNHLIWEAVGLYFAGSLLSGVPGTGRWASAGRRILDQQAERQIYPDGGYIQQSNSYHRMAIQAYLVASILNEKTPPDWRAAVERSLDFLVAQQNPTTGQLPNFGANDGTLPCILSTCDYTDFRPALQSASLFARGERLYEPGPWDEEAAWLLGSSSLERPLHRPLFSSRSFEHTGQHVLRGKDGGSFAVFRCGSLQDRFSQIDMLHLDVWWHGHNVLADPGSYLYNGPREWHDHFLRTESHNTVQVDHRDQMLHYRRFKCLYWTRAKLLRFEDNADWALCEGEHYGYQRHPGRCVHRRSVLLVKDDLWVVADRMEGSGTHHVRIHWLGGNFPYCPGLDGQTSLRLETPDGPFHVGVFNAAGGPLSGAIVAGQDDPPRGWLSRYYGEKVPVPSLVVEMSERLPFTLVSILSPHVPFASVSASTWSVTAGNRIVEFELSAAGIQPRSLMPAAAPVS
jgi:Heparinase II/III-like protein/Heparinase II/III N-terminus